MSWYAHVLHAPNDPVGYRMFGLDYYDAVLLSGQYQIDQVRELESLRHLPEKEARLVGLPHLDALKQRWDAWQQKQTPQIEKAPTVLLAPTWGESGILHRFGNAIFDALLATDYHIIVRPHPQSFVSEKKMLQRLQTAYPPSDHIEWNTDSDNFDALCRADLLISDFSGIIFDYALVFDRPVLYADTSFDKSPYDAWWLKEEMWTFSILPEIGRQLTKEDLPHLASLMEEERQNGVHKAGRKKARQETWAYPGEGAVRVVAYLEEKLHALESADQQEDV